MLFRRPTFNENFTAELYKSLPNAPGEWGTIPVTFKYRFLDKKEQRMYKPIKGVVSDESTLFITSSNCEHEINIGDKIVLADGDSMIVDSFGLIYDDKHILNMGKFDSQFLQKRLPKALSLKN